MKKIVLVLVLLLSLILLFSACEMISQITNPNPQSQGGNNGNDNPSEGLEFTSNGDGTCYVSGIGECTDLDIVIPFISPSGDRVTSIGSNAFYHCSSLTSVTIPDSVTNIGYKAFSSCSNLQYNVYDNAKYLGNANNPYFALIESTNISITSCKIHPDTKVIAEGPFYDCFKLKNVTIPDSVTSIGGAFYGCKSLTSVTIPDSVTWIGDYAFHGCKSLTSVAIPDSVTYIGYEAFYNCTSLTSVTIPDSVTSIGDDAFFECTSLTSVYITDIAKWCAISFGDNTANPLCYAHNLYLNGELVTDLVIPEGVTSIGNYAFYTFSGCSSLTSVTIPDSVTSIGDDAFSECTSLTSVYITDIAKWCAISFGGTTANPLYYAHNLYLNGELVTDLVISDSVTNIGDSVFSGCTSLTSITIPDSVTSIGGWAFCECYDLTSIVYQGTKAQWNAISKEDYWNDNTGDYTIYCTNGDIEK